MSTYFYRTGVGHQNRYSVCIACLGVKISATCMCGVAKQTNKQLSCTTVPIIALSME